MPNFLNISQFYANFFEFLYKYKNYSLSLQRIFKAWEILCPKKCHESYKRSSTDKIVNEDNNKLI